MKYMHLQERQWLQLLVKLSSSSNNNKFRIRMDSFRTNISLLHTMDRGRTLFSKNQSTQIRTKW